MSGRLVRGDDGRWVYLTHEELVEASDRRWAALVAESEADARYAAVAESQVSGLVSDLEAYVDERRSMIRGLAKKPRASRS